MTRRVFDYSQIDNTRYWYKTIEITHLLYSTNLLQSFNRGMAAQTYYKLPLFSSFNMIVKLIPESLLSFFVKKIFLFAIGFYCFYNLKMF